MPVTFFQSINSYLHLVPSYKIISKTKRGLLINRNHNHNHHIYVYIVIDLPRASHVHTQRGGGGRPLLGLGLHLNTNLSLHDLQRLLLVPVTPREPHKHAQIDPRDHHQEGVVVIEVRLVEVVPYPAASAGGLVDDGDEEAVEEVAEADAAGEERGAEALHVLGGLVVEELEDADRVEHVADPEQHILRQQPEDAHRHDCVGGGDAVLPDHAHAPELDQVGDSGDEDVEEEADAEALEQRDASGVASAAPGEGDEEAVVEGDGEEHGEGDEGAEGSRGEAETPAEGAVEGGALLHEERVHLRPDGAGDQRGEPHHAHAQHKLRLLHLGHRARRAASAPFHSRLVQEPTYVRACMHMHICMCICMQRN